MREPSSMRELITTVRFHCKRSLGEEQRPNKATEEEGEEEEEDADGLRLRVVIYVFQFGKNHNSINYRCLRL